MVNILLVCTAGMSTSVLVEKMKKYAEEKGVDATINAVGDSALKENMDSADVILLGPQVKFLFNRLRTIVPEDKPMEVINMIDYGTMNAKKVFDRALELIEKGE